VRRFSTKQDASSKNPGHNSVDGFELDLNVFFGYFLCAKESNSRTSAKKVPGFTSAASAPKFTRIATTPSKSTLLKQTRLRHPVVHSGAMH
jgi:hypothetical protein